MLVIGLTGGIATGKSTVSAIFKSKGAVVLDADVMARQVVAPGLPAWQAIRSMFGDGIIQPNGAINRARLGELAFKDASLRKQLEEIVHPHVRTLMDMEVARLRKISPHALVVKDIPLMIETGMTDGLAEIIVVYVTPQIQLKRLMERDGIGAKAAQARIDAQMPIDEKRVHGTIVIDNSKDITHTQKQTIKIFEALSNRAARG